MKTQNKTINSLLILLLLPFILPGCQAHLIVRTEEIATATSSIQVTETQTPTIEQHPIATPTRTPSVKSTFTPAPTRTATWTPIPTLGGEEADKKIQELVSDNGNCELPCVWGLIPGETVWAEARQIFQSFSRVDEEYDYKSSSTIVFSISYPIPGYAVLDSIGGITKNNKIVRLSLGAPTTLKRYKLAQILSDYGAPEDVYINTGHSMPFGYMPFIMVLYYPKVGFSTLFVYQADIRNEQVVVCPTAQPIGPEIETWAPQVQTTIGEIFQRFFTNPIPSMIPIQKALNLNIEEFAHIFRNENSDKCFQSPIEIWQ